MENESSFYIDKSDNPSYPIGGTYGAEPNQKPKKSKALMIFIIIGLILIGFFGAVLASRTWDPIWNPFRPSPEKVLARAFLRQNEIKTQSANIFIYADAKTATDDAFSVEIKMESDTDIRDENVLKSSSKFDYKILIGPISVPLSGEATIIGEEIYFKLDALPLALFQFFKMSGADVFNNPYIDGLENIFKGIIGKWIRISPKDTGINFSINTRKQKELSEAINNIIAKYPAFKAKKQFADKEISGNKTYHYLLALDKENLKKLLPEILETIKNSGMFPMAEKNPSDKGEIEEAMKELDDLLNKTGEITTEIWIGKNDYYIYKIKGEKTIDVSAISDGREKGVIKIGWDALASDFNQPIEIKAPENSIGIVELIYSIVEPVWNSLPPVKTPNLKTPIPSY